MQSLSPRFPRRATLVHAVVVLGLGGLLAACDRHSAAEVPESYGHGSSHERSYTDHQIDSRRDSRSFSDTQGIEVTKEEKSADQTHAATPAGTAAPGHFFPSGS